MRICQQIYRIKVSANLYVIFLKKVELRISRKIPRTVEKSINRIQIHSYEVTFCICNNLYVIIKKNVSMKNYHFKNENCSAICQVFLKKYTTDKLNYLTCIIWIQFNSNVNLKHINCYCCYIYKIILVLYTGQLKYYSRTSITS